MPSYSTWLKAGNRSPGTIRLRTYYLNRLACVHADPWGVTPDQLAAWLAQPDWSPQTRKSARAALVGFYRWATLTGRLDTSPADALLPVLVPRRPVTVPDDQLIDAALAVASQRDRLMILLGSRAGLRRAEIAGLAWDDITDTALVVRAGKGGHARVVPLSTQLRHELDAERCRRRRGELGTGWRYQVDPGSRWVFPAQRGGPMSPDTVGAIITRALNTVETSHGLRRRFATRAYRGTRDIRAVQELLGHASVATTQRYVATGRDDLVAAVDAAA